MEYEVQRSNRHCAATGRELAPGEEFYSVLIEEGVSLVRKDYASEAWQGPPEGAVGWWKSQVPTPEARRAHWAPNDVMLEVFEQLQQQPGREDMRYVLALLLVRRRVLRLEEESRDAEGREVLVLYCPRQDASHHVPVVVPEESRVLEIQEELMRLLFGRAGNG